MTTPTKIAKLRAADRLQRAIDAITAQGLRHHCADPEKSHLWLSEHPEERQEAIKLCKACPIEKVCGEVASARREQFGVWGGHDRTRHPNRVGRPPKSAVR